MLHTSFIPDSDVPDIFCAADVVVQPYRNATQSGHGLPIRDRAFNMSPHPSATAAQIMTTP